MRNFKLLLALLSCVALASDLRAHGPELDYQGGEIFIHTGTTIAGLPSYEEELVFNFANLGWQVLPPSAGGGHLGMGDLIGLSVHDWNSLVPSLAPSTYLLFHDGVNFASPGAASLAILATTGVVTAGSVNFSDLPIGEVFDPEDFHSHLGFLLSNGSTGAYALLISNTTDSPGIQDSQPYIMLLNNNLGAAGYTKAVSDLENLIAVPEIPSSMLIGIAGVIVAGVSVVRRRRASAG